MVEKGEEVENGGGEGEGERERRDGPRVSDFWPILTGVRGYRLSS